MTNSRRTSRGPVTGPRPGGWETLDYSLLSVDRECNFFVSPQKPYGWNIFRDNERKLRVLWPCVTTQRHPQWGTVPLQVLWHRQEGHVTVARNRNNPAFSFMNTDCRFGIPRDVVALRLSWLQCDLGWKTREWRQRRRKWQKKRSKKKSRMNMKRSPEKK